MFGQSNNTPFGGGFGQQPTNTTPAFGSPNPGQPQPGGLFSSPPPVFGQQQQQQAPTTAFGAPTNTFGGGFGTQQSASPSGQPGMFGAPAPVPTGFGGGAFGAAPVAPTNTFGSTGGGLFGSAPAVGGFGQPTPPSGGLFGQAPASAFGAAPTSTFGAPTSTFGAPSTGLFGAAPVPTNAFGAPSPTAFGAPTGFGAPAPSVFGAPAAPPSNGFFGGTSAPAPFGAPAPVGGLFGSTPAPVSTGFGTTTSLFGSTPAPATTFGSPPAPSSAFGAPGGLFGSNASVTSAVSGGGGTRIASYQTTTRQDGTANINLQSISAMEQYKDQSHEELRFADYSQGNRGTAPVAPTPGFGGFGAQAPAPIGSSLFGGTPAPASTFGSTGGSLFGATPAPAFGAAPAPLGGFGQTAGGSLFGQTPAPSAAFAAPASAFGSPAPTGLFGAPAPTGLFGSNPAPVPFGAPAPSGLFGATPAPSTGFGGLLGSNPAPSTFGAPAPGGLFGAPAPANGGLFGSPPPAAPFGQSFGAQPAPSLFGAAPTSGFGAPASYFGQPAPQQQFQQQIQPLQVQTMFNAPIIAPGVSEVLEQQMRALTNQLDENKKLEVWRGPKASTSPASTPTSNHNTTTFFSRNSGNDGLMYRTPSSTTQIRPRGFAQSEPYKPAVSVMPARDNSGLMSPEAFARSSQLNLVVRPDSLRRLNKLNLHRLNHENSTTTPSIPEPSIDPIPTEQSIDPLPLSIEENVQSVQYENSQDPVISPALQIVEAPTKSPGYEYYQQVIGKSHQSKNQPITPVANGTANGIHWYIPKLTKAGYEVWPTLGEMSCLSEADLASVRSFTVSRPGYGKVEWDGSVDVRGANLDEIVVIEAKDVSVYNLDEEKGTKPDEGTKLNRPALITFEDVFPKEGGYASEEVKSKFTIKLKKAVQNMNAAFVSYDGTNGIWKIRVQHFSRYALVDDDDSDTEINNTDVCEEIIATPMPKGGTHKKRKATPYAASRMTFVDVTENEEEEDFSNNEVMVFDNEPREMDIRERAQKAARAIQASLKGDISSSLVTKAISEMDNDTDEYEEEDDDNEANDPQCEQFDMHELFLARKSSLHANAFAAITNKKYVCVSHMKRSFRVGWLPNGSFLKVDTSSNSLTHTLVISQPILSDGKSNDASVALLNTQQRAAVALSSGENECPLYKLCGDFGNVASTLDDSDEAKHAFLFLMRIFPVSHLESAFASYDEKVPLDAQHVTAANRLLLDLCLLNENEATKNENLNVVAEIHAAFSIGNIELACQLSARAGFTALAAMLTCSPTAQGDVSSLLHEISQTKELKNITDPTLNRVLQYSSEDSDVFRSERKTLDWRRSLAMWIRQHPNKTLLQILNGYEMALVRNEVPYPLPSYLTSSSYTSSKSMFYRLLQICSNPKLTCVCEAIDPSGFTPFLHDFYLPFHLAAAMTSVSDHSFQLSSNDTEYIKDGYIVQLIMQGHWERAVFVLLCCIGDDDHLGTTTSTSITSSVVRQNKQNLWLYNTYRAKSLIFRYYDEHDLLAEERRRYLVANIGVPSFWFDEATCYRNALVDGDVVKSIHTMNSFDIDMWRDACTAYICPDFILHRTNMDTDAFLSTLIAAASGASSDSFAMTLFRYLELEKRLISYRNQMQNKYDDTDDNRDENEQLQILHDNVNYLYDYFFKLNVMTEKQKTMPLSSSSSLLPNLDFLPTESNKNKRMPLNAMVSEVLRNVTQWKKEITIQWSDLIESNL